MVLQHPEEQFDAAQLEAVAVALDDAGLLEMLGTLLEACQMPVQAVSAYRRWDITLLFRGCWCNQQAALQNDTKCRRAINMLICPRHCVKIQKFMM